MYQIPIPTRFGIWKEMLWTRPKMVLAMIYGFLSFADFVRGKTPEIFPDWILSTFVPDLTLWQWIAAGGFLLIGIILHGTYKVILHYVTAANNTLKDIQGELEQLKTSISAARKKQRACVGEFIREAKKLQLDCRLESDGQKFNRLVLSWSNRAKDYLESIDSGYAALFVAPDRTDIPHDVPTVNREAWLYIDPRLAVLKKILDKIPQ